MCLMIINVYLIIHISQIPTKVLRSTEVFLVTGNRGIQMIL